MVRAGQIEHNFTYQPPTAEKIEKHEDVREQAKEYAYMLNDLLPESREKALALTKIEEAVMWANAAIARNGQVNHD